MSPRKNKRRPVHPWYQPMLVRIVALMETAVGIGRRGIPFCMAVIARLRPGITAAMLKAGTLTRIVWRRVHPFIHRATLRLLPLLTAGLRYLDPRIVRLENPDRHTLHSAVISGAMAATLILAVTLAACS